MSDMDDEELLEEIARDLGLPLDENVKREVIKYTKDLENKFEGFEEEYEDLAKAEIEPSDKYNALLDVYNNPRSENSKGLLKDLDIAIKDNIAVKGLYMTIGSKNMSYVPSFDATVVERLLDEGASIVGKANMDKFAVGPMGEWSDFENPINPIDKKRVPGGSSSGSGVAVATGMVDAALGSDTGGSIRSPAGLVGIVGVRPTHRLVPRHGFVENKPSYDTIGPLARDVTTAAKVLEVIAGYDPRDPTSSRKSIGELSTKLDDWDDLTIGLVTTTLDLASDEVAQSIKKLSDKLSNVPDVEIVDVELEFDNADFAYSLLGTENTQRIKESYITRGFGVQYEPELQSALKDAKFSKHISQRMLPGTLLDEKTNGMSYVKGKQKAIEFEKELTNLFEEVDLLLTPTHRMLPPKIGEIQNSEDGIKYNFTKPFSLYNGPSVAVPAGEFDGLPISAQIAAPRFNDLEALQGAKVIEEVSQL